MNCPNCGNQLRPGAVFCARCGASTQQAAAPQASNSPPTVKAGNLNPAYAPMNTPDPAMTYSPPAPAPTYLPQPAYAPAPHAIGQLGATGQSSSLWGPFAGYGLRREHTAWLLQGLGRRAEDLRDKVTEQFGHRQIPEARVDLIILTGKGVGVEQRPFYRIQRGLATVWLYIARFGEDLYISQVSYIKGQISLARILLLLGLVVLVGISWLNNLLVLINLQQVANSLGSFGGRSLQPNGLLIGALCCTSPLGFLAQLALLFGFIFSLYKLATEKDLLALLRARPNEFQEDDIVSLEKTVNETVRQGADIVGIDLKLLEPGKAYNSNRRMI